MRGRAAPFRAPQSLVYVVGVSAGKGCNDGPSDFLGNGGDRFEVAGGAGGKAGFDDVYAEAVQLPGDFQLFRCGHSRAGGLFAVAESSVEDFYLFVSHFGSSSYCLLYGNQGFGVGLPKGCVRGTQIAHWSRANTPAFRRSTRFASMTSSLLRPIFSSSGTLQGAAALFAFISVLVSPAEFNINAYEFVNISVGF